jgi:hypothetical protein
MIKLRGVRLPAHYSVEKREDIWLAVFIPSVSPSNNPREIPKKPRTKGLKNMLPEKAQNE